MFDIKLLGRIKDCRIEIKDQKKDWEIKVTQGDKEIETLTLKYAGDMQAGGDSRAPAEKCPNPIVVNGRLYCAE